VIQLIGKGGEEILGKYLLKKGKRGI